MSILSVNQLVTFNLHEEKAMKSKLLKLMLTLALVSGVLSASVIAQPPEYREAPAPFLLPRYAQTANAPVVSDPAVQRAPGEVNMPGPIMNFEGLDSFKVALEVGFKLL